jgi:hypothetical protein
LDKPPSERDRRTAERRASDTRAARHFDVETPEQTVAIEFAARVVATFMPALTADGAGLIDLLP